MFRTYIVTMHSAIVSYKAAKASRNALSLSSCAVTYSIIVSRISYALPAWGGFIGAELMNKINAF